MLLTEDAEVVVATAVAAANLVAAELPTDPHANAVTRWFGPRFAQLHPLLQDLHRRGGKLSGRVHITLGRGPVKWIGRRLASRLGVPTDRSERSFEVEIAHSDTALMWNRRFDDGTLMRSVFEPVGTWPDGHWIERTGPLQMRLMVDVVDGGWQWRPLGMRFAGVPLPLWLFPKSQAGKRIVDGRYVFSVVFVLPVVGTLLRYEGALDAQSDHHVHGSQVPNVINSMMASGTSIDRASDSRLDCLSGASLVKPWTAKCRPHDESSC